MKKFEQLTKQDLSHLNGGVALGPLIWFKLLPLPKGSKSKNPSGLVVL
ncbi:hypothetical protein ACTGYH_10005 [Streptococcus suis]